VTDPLLSVLTLMCSVECFFAEAMRIPAPGLNPGLKHGMLEGTRIRQNMALVRDQKAFRPDEAISQLSGHNLREV